MVAQIPLFCAAPCDKCFNCRAKSLQGTQVFPRTQDLEAGRHLCEFQISQRYKVKTCLQRKKKKGKDTESCGYYLFMYMFAYMYVEVPQRTEKVSEPLKLEL